MNTIARAANGAWSAVCLLVAAVLTGLFIYWAVLQQPFITIDKNVVQSEYRVTAGSLLYIDNPVEPSEAVAKVQYTAVLIKDQFTKYALPSPDVASRAEVEDAETVVAPTKPAAPLYAVFIPSYIQPGKYKYQITASYKLNPFRTETLELPQLSITVE